MYTGNLFWSRPTDTYITRGGSAEGEEYEPSFTYHGFRYVEVQVSNGTLGPRGTASPLELSSLVGVNFRTDAAEVGTIAVGADRHAPSNLVQRVSNNSWWTEAAALMSIPAGCAGRGERNGWTGDAAFGSESECFDFDTGAFFSRYLEQVVDSQAPDGAIGGGVPNQGSSPAALHPAQDMRDPSWGAVFPLVAYNLWKHYNCTTCIDGAWDGLRRYHDLLVSNYTSGTEGGIQRTRAFWGDWNPAYPAPGRDPTGAGPRFTRTLSHITAATMVLQNLGDMAEMATATGRPADAVRYRELLAPLRAAYHTAFYDEVGAIYGDGTPTAFGAALWLELTPPSVLPEAQHRKEKPRLRGRCRAPCRCRLRGCRTRCGSTRPSACPRSSIHCSCL